MVYAHLLYSTQSFQFQCNNYGSVCSWENFLNTFCFHYGRIYERELLLQVPCKEEQFLILLCKYLPLKNNRICAQFICLGTSFRDKGSAIFLCCVCFSCQGLLLCVCVHVRKLSKTCWTPLSWTGAWQYYTYTVDKWQKKFRAPTARYEIMAQASKRSLIIPCIRVKLLFEIRKKYTSNFLLQFHYYYNCQKFIQHYRCSPFY